MPPLTPHPDDDATLRIWCPVAFADRRARPFQVSFRVGEEATWDHRFHDPDGREISAAELQLSPDDQRFIQASCDGAVGAAGVSPKLPPANDRDELAPAIADIGVGRA